MAGPQIFPCQDGSSGPAQYEFAGTVMARRSGWLEERPHLDRPCSQSSCPEHELDSAKFSARSRTSDLTLVNSESVNRLKTDYRSGVALTVDKLEFGIDRDCRALKAMASHRSHSVAQEFIAGEMLHALASRHGVSPQPHPFLGAELGSGSVRSRGPGPPAGLQ